MSISRHRGAVDISQMADLRLDLEIKSGSDSYLTRAFVYQL